MAAKSAESLGPRSSSTQNGSSASGGLAVREFTECDVHVCAFTNMLTSVAEGAHSARSVRSRRAARSDEMGHTHQRERGQADGSRPSASAATNAAWSRTVWSAYASANSAIAVLNVLDVPT